MIDKRLVIALFGAFAFSADVSAYTLGASYTWSSGVPNYNASATIHSGTIDTSTIAVGDFLGRNPINPNAASFGDSGVSVGWDDTWVSGVGNANTNGDALDGLWSQIFADGGWWDLGSAYDSVAVFSSQDHGPYLGEGLEYRVFGTNTLWDNTSLSAQAILSDVYLDGWRTHNPAEDSNGNGWLSDDVSGVFQLDGSYQYIKLVAWGGGSFTEPEIDAVAGMVSVSEPASLALMGLGLAGLGFARRKKAA